MAGKMDVQSMSRYTRPVTVASKKNKIKKINPWRYRL
jgi:hypothetical protein